MSVFQENSRYWNHNAQQRIYGGNMSTLPNEFYFIYVEDPGTTYFARKSGSLYIVEWFSLIRGKMQKTGYAEKTVLNFINTGVWVICSAEHEEDIQLDDGII